MLLHKNRGNGIPTHRYSKQYDINDPAVVFKDFKLSIYLLLVFSVNKKMSDIINYDLYINFVEHVFSYFFYRLIII